jgi:hypothetical protein
VYAVHLGLLRVYGVHPGPGGTGVKTRKEASVMTSERTLARIAGSLYLVVAVGELWLVAWLL